MLRLLRVRGGPTRTACLEEQEYFAGTDDGQKYMKLADDFADVADSYVKRDALASRKAAQALVSCQQLLDKHTFESDPQGAELLSRIKFWLQIISGRYAGALETASTLFEKTSGQRYYVWIALASDKAGEEAPPRSPVLHYRPQATLAAANFLLMAGETAKARSLLRGKAAP
ncbi:MAG: hypothetical protein U5N86_04095, partial [Planctomycetota bacterium]|nr:hypothetical protein [Planctomycetota bacterium]